MTGIKMTKAEEFKYLLRRSGLSRSQLAIYMGIKVQSTYWRVPPQTAFTILILYIEAQKLTRLKETFKEVLAA